MRTVFLAAAIASAVPAFAAERENYQIRHTADLVRVCATEPQAPGYASAIAFCHGILVGAYAFYESSTPADARYVCPPNPPPSRSKVMNDFVAWANARPQYLQSNGVDTLLRFLAATYPCKK